MDGAMCWSGAFFVVWSPSQHYHDVSRRLGMRHGHGAAVMELNREGLM